MTTTETEIPVRERLGRLVRETWVAWAQEQPDPKPSWLLGWDELNDEGQREVDMRIGEAVAAAAGPGVEEVAKLRDACRLMGRCISGQARSMEAARIEMVQGSTEKAMQWILNSLPDQDDNAPEDQWNGTETANEWWDRTDAFYREPAPATGGQQ